MHQHEPRRPVQRRDQPHHEEKTALRGFEDLHWKPNEVVHDEQQPQHLARLDEVSFSCGRQAVDASLSWKGYIQIQKLIYIYIVLLLLLLLLSLLLLSLSLLLLLLLYIHIHNIILIYMYIMNPIYILVSPEAADPG